MDYKETSYYDSSSTNKDYVLSDINFETSKCNLLSVLSKLHDEGWETLSFANEYLNRIEIDAYKISLDYYGAAPGKDVMRRMLQLAVSHR